VRTAFTVGIASLEEMEARAAAHRDFALLKLKAGPDDALARIDAVRRGHPGAQLVVDANESWSLDAYRELAPALPERGVVVLEQPLPRGEDEALATEPHPVPLCADESLRGPEDLAAVGERYEVGNVKLPKAGGLDRALALGDAVRAAGLELFVGCMVGSSLGLAPAHLVAQDAAFVDLDGALHLATDRVPPLRCEGDLLYPPEPELWG